MTVENIPKHKESRHSGHAEVPPPDRTLINGREKLHHDEETNKREYEKQFKRELSEQQQPAKERGYQERQRPERVGPRTQNHTVVCNGNKIVILLLPI